MRHALPEGTVFANRYRVLRCVAAGGMGAVYEVIHLETERRRALKVMLPHVLDRADLRERFKREAKIAAGIDCEHIIEVFDAGLDEATEMPFIVMELLKGEDLGKRLKRTGRFPAAEVLTYLHQTALALEETHRASIVHRDLKPDNLFLTERRDGTPRIKVLDFGIAKIIAEGANQGLTEALGTPLYMPPEQFRMTMHVSPAIDIHALGMIAYTLLVGVPYWREESSANGLAFTVVASLGVQERATARAARAGVTLPAAFDGWFARATAFAPEARFQSATAAVSALADALAAAQIYARISLPDTTSPHTPVMTLPEGAAAPVGTTTIADISLATITVTEGSTRALPPTPPPRWRPLAFGAGAAIVGVGVLGFWLGRPAPGGTVQSPGAGSPTVSSATAETTAATAATAEPPAAPPASTSTAASAAVSASASASATASASPPGGKPKGKTAPGTRRPPPARTSEDDEIYKRH